MTVESKLVEKSFGILGAVALWGGIGVSNTEFRFGILGALGIHSRRWKKGVFLGILGAGFWRFFGIVGAKIRHSRGVYTYRSCT